MSRNVVIVTYYLGRRKLGSSDGFTDEVWVVAVVRPETAVRVRSQRSVDCPVDSAVVLGERLREAVDDVLADDVEGLVWKADDLPEGELDGFIASLPDRLQALADEPLGGLADAIGMPAAAASITSQVAGTMLLKPVLEPVKDAVHGFEVVGVVIGLLTGAHGLVFTCVEHLLHDILGDLLSKVFSDAAEALDRQPSSAAGPQVADELIFDADPVTTDLWEPEPPRGVGIDPATGMARRKEDIAAEVADEARATASPGTQRLFRAGKQPVSDDPLAPGEAAPLTDGLSEAISPPSTGLNALG